MQVSIFDEYVISKPEHLLLFEKIQRQEFQKAYYESIIIESDKKISLYIGKQKYKENISQYIFNNTNNTISNFNISIHPPFDSKCQIKIIKNIIYIPTWDIIYNVGRPI